MSGNEAAVRAAVEIVRKAGTDIGAALMLAEQAARKFPTFTLPTRDDKPGLTFAQVVDGLKAKLADQAGAVLLGQTPAPVQTPESAPKTAARKPSTRKAAAKSAAPAAKPAPAPAPKPVEATELRIVHDGVNQTTIFGIEQDTPAVAAIGRAGEKWSFWRAEKRFYLRGSQGYAADMARVESAQRALESLKGDLGEPLYRVKLEIATTDADGKPLPVKMTREQAAQWQRAYTAAQNGLYAQLGLRRGVCDGCGAAGLTIDTARIVTGVGNMPITHCATCAGFKAPQPEPVAEPEAVFDLASLALALPAPDERADCPLCKVSVAVVDGKLALHTFRGGACRGRLGMVVEDVEPEAAAPKTAQRTPAARKASEPVKVAQSASDLLIMFGFQSAQLSSTARKETATDVRRALAAKITYGKEFRGVKIETRNDKVNKRLVLTVTDGGEGVDAAALTAAVTTVVKSVRGVGNRVHKTETVDA